MKGLDVSNFTGNIGTSKATELKAAGFDFAIVGAQIDAQGHSFTQNQIDDLRAGGLEVKGVYELLYWDDRDMQRMDHAMSFGLPVWVDCEWQALLSPADTAARIKAAVDHLGSYLAGIYTGRWWWVPSTGDSQAFRDLPLWHAEYRPDPFASFTHYGGWGEPTIWQYSDQGILGLNCDLNQMEDMAVAPPTQSELDERRAKAELDIALLFKYRAQWVGTDHVRLVNNDGSALVPPVLIDVSR